MRLSLGWTWLGLGLLVWGGLWAVGVPSWALALAALSPLLPFALWALADWRTRARKRAALAYHNRHLEGEDDQ